jgi:hypothetical protein
LFLFSLSSTSRLIHGAVDLLSKLPGGTLSVGNFLLTAASNEEGKHCAVIVGYLFGLLRGPGDATASVARPARVPAYSRTIGAYYDGQVQVP